ncbi:MAG: glycosyltransferase 87 family protein, partial [Pseudomonadota bacterium]|nr:glycosyltransferase 87 family protein [Pseudomonadota bacterium]
MYQKILTGWMLFPFPHPFIDWQFVPAAAECWSRGINVYIATPCYDLFPTMPHPYSPLWLRFSFLPSNPAATAVFGVGWAVLFWVSQAYLPPPRTRLELCLTLLVTLSSSTAFALERGNIDLVIFLLALLGCRLWIGSLRLRLTAYAVFLFAGMLKFYPLILMLLVIRERPRVFLQITVVVSLILAAAVIDVRDELAAVAHNIPVGSYFSDLFGSVNLPSGLPVLMAYVGSKFDGHSHVIDAFTWMSVPAYGALVFATVFGAAV